MAQAVPATDLYETDFYAWTQDQAARLRRLQAQAVNLDLDLPHLAEEVEDLGKAERNAVRSQVRRLLEHCLKLEHSRSDRPRGQWRASIIEARAELSDRLTATLARDLEQRLPVLYEQARDKAESDLRAQGEPDAAEALPAFCPYRLPDLLQRNWYPANRHGLAD